MVHRKFWLEKIEKAWKQRSVVWLSGVRRVGKTCLSQTLSATEYFDCELPRIRRIMDDPESFLDDLRGGRIILDEIHRLDNPSQLLKIAADYYPDIQVLATGSSTLGASTKFRDTLAGRKMELWLTPITLMDLEDFGNSNFEHRFLHGGLPPFFLSDELPERNFQEWMDAYWAKDIQELFRLERRYSFQKFVELLMVQSGGIFEATRFSRPCEVSRSTISNYLRVLEDTYVVHVLRPFSTRRASEIISAPKVYAFDTGFICYHRGWRELRQEDMGHLWEHFVLNELNANLQSRKINYWRDKRGHEVDFVLAPPGSEPFAIECKWSSDGFNPGNFLAFRKQYPSSRCYVVSHDVKRPYIYRYRDVPVQFTSLSALVKTILNRKTQ